MQISKGGILCVGMIFSVSSGLYSIPISWLRFRLAAEPVQETAAVLIQMEAKQWEDMRDRRKKKPQEPENKRQIKFSLSLLLGRISNVVGRLPPGTCPVYMQIKTNPADCTREWSQTNKKRHTDVANRCMRSHTHMFPISFAAVIETNTHA